MAREGEGQRKYARQRWRQLTQLAGAVSSFIGCIPVVVSESSLCSQVFNFDAFYTVALLQATNYYSYQLAKNQGNFSFPLNVTTTALPDDYIAQRLLFNFCDTVSLATTETCSSEANANPAFALTFDTSTQTQINCTDAITKLTTDSKLDNYEFEQIDSDRPQDGIIYSQYRLDQSINDTTQEISTLRTQITYIMYCDSTAASNNFTVQGWKYLKNATNETFFMQLVSNQACPTLLLSKLWQILSDSSVVFTIVMIGIGGVLCFFGLKIYNPTLFIIGFMTGFGSIVVIMGEFVIRHDSESLMAYACLIIAVLFGLLVGYVTVQNPKLGYFALGMWLGIVIALLFNNAFLYKIQISNQFVVLWVTILVLATVMGLLSCFFYKHCMMVCTGFIGSYCLIRPLGWMIGSFPNELQIAKELKYGTITSVPALFYLYFALIIIVGLIGIRFQYSMYVSRRRGEKQRDLQHFLADPEFVELNKGLLEREDTDLNEKEKETKKKLIRMEKNIEKENKRQKKMQAESLVYKNQMKKKQENNTSSSDEESERRKKYQNSKEKEGSEQEEEEEENEEKKETTGFFGSMMKSLTGKTGEDKKGKRKKSQTSSDSEDEEVELKQKKQKSQKNGKNDPSPVLNNRKFSQME